MNTPITHPQRPTAAPHFAFRNPQSAIRTGISLLEVLISIGVISIGLLGVAALLPVAQHFANRGAMADRAAAAGKAALREFEIREINNPDNWLTAAGASALTAYDPLNPGGAKAFCIDPRLTARDNTVTEFPFVGTNKMPRLNLRREAGGLAAGGPAMNTAMADFAFTMHDDLSFYVDKDNAEPPPLQNFDGTAANGRRLDDGEFSWLATLVREGSGDRYTLSVVVFYRRGNENTPAGPVKPNVTGAVADNAPADEVNLQVTFLGSGIGGGDVSFTGSAKIGAGNWVLLSGGGLFRWYRVVYAAESGAGELSLVGRDWPGAIPNTTVVQGTYIPGVVAVYERTVRLETSSLWNK